MMIGASSRPWVVLVIMTLLSSLWPAGPAQASPPPDPADPPAMVAQAATSAAVMAALGLDAALVTSVSFGTSDPNGYGVLTPTTPITGLPSQLNGLPTQGASFLVLTNGHIDNVLDPTADLASYTQPIATLKTFPGDNQDLVQMTLVLSPPSWAKSWSVQWKFLSEEFPEYVDLIPSDHFLLETGATNFIVDPVTHKVSPPNNIAFDPTNQLISTDLTGAAALAAPSAVNAALNSVYDGATPLMTTANNIPAGTSSLTLVFSIFDVADNTFDSAVFLDNFVFSPDEVAPGSQLIFGGVSGRIFKNPQSDLNSLVGAPVEICSATSNYCQSTTSIARGQYGFRNLPAGDYYVTASPPPAPAGDNLVKNSIGPITISAATPVLTARNVVLFPPKTLPPNTGFTTNYINDDGVPVITGHMTLDLTTQGCPGGTATYQVIANGQVIRSGPMAEAPAGSYAAEISPLEGYGGYISVKFTITCPNNTTSTGEFNVYIDPSGFVRTVQGTPVVGAIVTLYKFNDATGLFAVVPNQSSIMSPNNRTNPDLTDATGHFGWDVVAGLYKVRASKAGCTAPYTGAAFVETEVMVIPPPVFDLDLRLNCGGTENGWGQTTWYFAEGYTGTGFDEYLTIQNPNALAAELTITYYLGGGQAPVTRNVSVPGNSRYTVAVHETSQGVGRGQEVSAKVVSTNNVGVVVERPMYFRYTGSMGVITGGHNVMGITSPRTNWLFAEGYTGAGFDEYLTLMNPNGAIAPVTITYYLAGGGTVVKTVNVAANSRSTVVVHDTALGVGRDKEVSAKVETTLAGGIVVERPIYFSYQGSLSGGANGGHNVMGAPGALSTWFFGEGYTGSGFDGYATIMNPFGNASAVRLTYYVAGQTAPTTKTITVAANSRRTVVLHETTEGVGRDKSFGLKVETTNDVAIVVERPMYFRYGSTINGGHNVMGANGTRSTWMFAEGYTGTGFDEYLTLLNPGNSIATITVTYYLASGAPITRLVTVPAIGRTTLSIHDAGQVGRDQAVSVKLESTNGIAIIAERPMYFMYSGSTAGIDGGHTVMGYAP